MFLIVDILRTSSIFTGCNSERLKPAKETTVLACASACVRARALVFPQELMIITRPRGQCALGLTPPWRLRRLISAERGTKQTINRLGFWCNPKSMCKVFLTQRTCYSRGLKWRTLAEKIMCGRIISSTRWRRVSKSINILWKFEHYSTFQLV